MIIDWSLQTQSMQLQKLSELKKYADELAQILRPLRRWVLLLDGPMGAGKTQLTKFLLHAFGSVDVVSPSFAIHNSYSSDAGEIDHFDLFRIETGDDLESTGFWDFLTEDRRLVIEWAERLGKLKLGDSLPRTWPCIKITLTVPSSSQQIADITVAAHESRAHLNQSRVLEMTLFGLIAQKPQRI